MDLLVKRLKALGDENRFRIMMMLRERSLCSCEILRVLDIAGGTLSAHLRILKEAGLMVQEKKGRWVVCSLASTAVASFVEGLVPMVERPEALEADRQAILSEPPVVENSICPRS